MAITLSYQPKEVTPAFNSIFFEFTSNQVAQADFGYVVKITDVISGLVQYYNTPLPTTASDPVRFDAMPFCADFITSELQPTTGNPLTYGFKVYNLVRPITVNVGENYGDSPEPVYCPGTDVTINVWNACLYKREFVTFQTMSFFNGGHQVLSSLLPEKVYDGYSTFLHLIDENSEFGGVRIISYGESGNVLQTSDIPNPYLGESPIEIRYLCIDLGMRSLSLINAGLVSGTYPPLAANAAYYEVYAINTADPSAYVYLKTYTVSCTNFTPYLVHYLARSGAFDTCVFDKNSFTSSDVDRQEYGSYYLQRPAPSSNENMQSYGITKSSNINEQETITLNTGFLTADERLKYTELISSPLVYLDLGTEGLTEIIPVRRSWDKTQRVRGKKENWTAEFRYASNESRQV